MYAILNNNSIITDIDYRNLPLNDLVHEGFRHLYIEIPPHSNLKIGDIWNSATATWESAALPVKSDEGEIAAPYQPTNAEIAQMISAIEAKASYRGGDKAMNWLEKYMKNMVSLDTLKKLILAGQVTQQEVDQNDSAKIE